MNRDLQLLSFNSEFMLLAALLPEVSQFVQTPLLEVS